jgi:putative tricarboxylic transport membrane protein
LISSNGSLGTFFSNSLVSSIMLLGLIALFWSVISAGIARIRGTNPATAA